MAAGTDYYRQLLRQYLNNDCTPQQVEEVLQFLQQDAANRGLLQELQAGFDQAMELKDLTMPVAVSENLQRRLMQKIRPRPPFYKSVLFRVAVAALLVIMLGAGTYFLFFNAPPVKETAGNTTHPPATLPTLPGRNKAFITMANGEQMVLDNAAGGTLTQQGQANIVQLGDDQLAYQADSLTTYNSPPTFNTLTVPRGAKMVTLTLADGTKVWVNTASSLRYPTVFTGNERSVELTGEAYFEVKHDGNKPFAVRTSHFTVNVLGTAFNVSAYGDDEQQQVVLEKGSVSLTANVKDGSQLLSPGQLASYTTGAGKLAVSAVNTDEYVSWRKGYLNLKRTPWEQLIKRLSRYYDVSIHTTVPAFKEETFSGRLDLQANLEDMMNLICTGTPFIYNATERKLIHR